LARKNPSLGIALAWVGISIIFLDFAVEKVQHLRASGQPVSALRYANVAFWGLLMLYWLWLAIRGYRSRNGES
jgi:hypothetical protein